MKSMTGFAEATATGSGLTASVTMRAVNHRGLDLGLRLRDELRALEPVVRRRIGERLARGRIDTTIELTVLDPALRGGAIDHLAVAAYLAAAAELRSQHGLEGQLTLADILRLPDVLRPASAGGLAAAAEPVVLEALDSALEVLIADREREGRALQEVLLALTASLAEAITSLRERTPLAIEAAKVALQTRVQEALGEVSLDRDRLAQELALLADRADVREELDRLEVHVAAITTAIEGEEPAGKRLEVLLQEVLRELSTLSAKSRDSVLKAEVIEARLTSERIREQAANVE